MEQPPTVVEASPTRQAGRLLTFLSGRRRARSAAETSTGSSVQAEEGGGGTASRRRASSSGGSSSGSGRSSLGLRRLFGPPSTASRRRRGGSASSLSSSSMDASRISDLTASGGLPRFAFDEDLATYAASLFQTQRSAAASIPAEEEDEEAMDDEPKLAEAASATMGATAAGTMADAWGEEDDDFPAPGGDWLGGLPTCDSPEHAESGAEPEQQEKTMPGVAVEGAATLPNQFDQTAFFSVAQEGEEAAQSGWGAVTAAMSSTNPFFETAAAAGGVESGENSNSSSIDRAQWPFAGGDEATSGMATTVSLPAGFFHEQEAFGSAGVRGGSSSGALGVTLPWELFEEEQPATPQRRGTLGHTLPEGLFDEQQQQQPATPQQRGTLGHTLSEGMFDDGAGPWGREEGGGAPSSVHAMASTSTTVAAGPMAQHQQQLERRRATEKRKRLGLSMEVLEQMLRAANEAAHAGPAAGLQVQWRPLPQLPSSATFSFCPPTAAFAPVQTEPPSPPEPEPEPALPVPAPPAVDGGDDQQQQQQPPQQHQQEQEHGWDHQPLLSPLQRTAASVPLLDDSASEGPSDDDHDHDDDEEEEDTEAAVEAAGLDDGEEEEGDEGELEISISGGHAAEGPEPEPEPEPEEKEVKPLVSDFEADAVLRAGLTHMRRTLALQGADAGRLFADPTCPLADALDRAALGWQLVTLELSGHGLRTLDAVAPAFAGLRVLRHLDLSHCQLASMRCPPGHRYPPTLRALVLHHNALTEIAGLDGGCAASLRSLDVAHNRIRRADGLAGLTGLASLDLSHNALTRPLHLRLLSFAPSITQLALAGNPVLRGLPNGGKAAALALLPRLDTLDGRPVRRALRKAPKPPTSPPPSPQPPRPAPTRAEQASADVRRAYAHVLAERARARARVEREAQEQVDERQWKPPAVPAAQQRAHVDELARPRSSPAAASSIASSSATRRCRHHHHALCDKPPRPPQHPPVGGRLYPPLALVAARRADILRGLIMRQLDEIVARQRRGPRGQEAGQEQQQQQQGSAASGAGVPEEEEEEVVDDEEGGEDGEVEEATVDRWLAIVEADAALSKAALAVALQATEAVLLQQQLIALPPAATTTGASTVGTMALARLPAGHAGALVLAAAGRELARVGRQLESTCRQLKALRRVALPRRLLLLAAAAGPAEVGGGGGESRGALVVRRAERANALKRDLAALLQHMLIVAAPSAPAHQPQSQQQPQRPPRVLEIGAPEKEGEEEAAATEAAEDRLLALPLLCATLREAHGLPLLTNGGEQPPTPASPSSSAFPLAPSSTLGFTAPGESHPWNRSSASSCRSSSISSPRLGATASPLPPPDLDRGQRAATAAGPDLSAYLKAQSRELDEVASAMDDAEDGGDARFETVAGGFGEGKAEEAAMWLQGWDDHYACHFYHNMLTGRSQWAPPEGESFLPYEDGEGGRTNKTRAGGLRRSQSQASGADGGSPRKTVTFSPRLVTIQMED